MDRFLIKTYLVLAFLLNGGQHFLFGQTGNPIKITITSAGDSLSQVLHQIENKYPVKFYIDPSSHYHRVVSSFNFINTPLDEALQKLLTGTNLGYIEFESYLVIISDSVRLNSNQFNDYFKRKKSIVENAIEYAIVIGRPDSINRSGLALIRGTIIDGTTDSVLRNMNIKLNDPDTTLKSSRSGNFNIMVPVGIHILTIESDEFQSFQQTLKVYSDGAIVIKLFANAFSLPEVVIAGSAQRRLENAVAGVAELTIKEIKRLPSLLGETDVLKALLTLPGVSNTGEVGSGYNVRGGNIDQNLILQEGAFHLNPTHVLGLFSAFNPDAIKNVTLYKGYIPAQYGGRTSSVLNIKLKDPDYKKWSVFGGIGPISSKLFLEGPIIKDRTSFFIGSRFTYSDWVLKLVRDPNLKNSSA
ncbi:MAG: Plug domain-containing protein, partial [Saprospiraceae bacterium]